jgi:hypothetical protein
MDPESGFSPEAEPEPKRDRRLWTVLAALPYMMPVGFLLLLAAGITLVAVGAYTREWEWTGFLGKTLWDWMKLLIVPIILALGGLLITQMDRLNNARAQRLDRERLELDRRQAADRLEQDRVQTQAQLQNAQEELRLTRQGQTTERFAHGIEQLGSEKLEIKLGGIYALERTAQEERNYHWPVMEILTSYVRRHAARKPDKESRESAATPEPDIQAILDVIGRRSEYHRTDKQVEYGTIELNNTDLYRADLQAASLQEANLQEANLQRAYGLTKEQIEWTIGSNETELPEDLNPPELWSKSAEEQDRIIREHIDSD